jgi:hypothetical protein
MGGFALPAERLEHRGLIVGNLDRLINASTASLKLLGLIRVMWMLCGKLPISTGHRVAATRYALVTASNRRIGD